MGLPKPSPLKLCRSRLLAGGGGVEHHELWCTVSVGRNGRRIGRRQATWPRRCAARRCDRKERNVVADVIVIIIAITIVNGTVIIIIIVVKFQNKIIFQYCISPRL